MTSETDDGPRPAKPRRRAAADAQPPGRRKRGLSEPAPEAGSPQAGSPAAEPQAKRKRRRAAAAPDQAPPEQPDTPPEPAEARAEGGPPGRRRRPAKPPSLAEKADEHGPPPGPTAHTKKALLVINRQARAANAEFGESIKILGDAGIITTVVYPTTSAEAAMLVASQGREVDLVVVGGGDGSISRLIPGVLEIDKPLGIFPLGTANDFARSIGLPIDLSDAAHVIAGGFQRRVDVGFIDGRAFINVAHIGFGAKVAEQHQGRLKRLLGPAAYPFYWWKAYRHTRPVHVRILADGEVTELDCAQLAIGPGHYYGSGFRIAEHARIDDGLLELYAVEPRGMAGWARLLPALRRGRLEAAPGTRTMAARTIRVEPRRPMRVNVDGDLEGVFPATVTIRQRALSVFTPEGGGA